MKLHDMKIGQAVTIRAGADFNAIADFLCNSLEHEMEASNFPTDAIKHMVKEFRLTKDCAKGLLDAWLKIDPIKQLHMGLQRDTVPAWIKKQVQICNK